MKKHWLNFKDKFESIDLRERGLMLGAALALFYMIWEFALFQPLEHNKKVMATRLKVAKQDVQTLGSRKQVLERLMKTDPNAALKAELKDLEVQIKKLDSQLLELSVGLIAADKLPEMLHAVLQNIGNLRVMKILTLPSEEVQYEQASATNGSQTNSAATNSQSGAEEGGVDIKLYKHGVRMEFQGDFFSVMQYLDTLERGGLKFYWESLAYDANKYPKATVKLNVFTLSTGRGVFGG